jgi:uncharacterized protein YndB with AHSA1/START domain
MNATRIEVQIGIQAPLEEVFTALVGSAALRDWFAEAADVSPDDSRYDFWGRYTPEDPGRPESNHPIVEFRNDRLLAYEWKLRKADTRVTLALEPARSARSGERGTRVELKHDDTPARRVEDGSLADWWALSLENLKSYVERGRMGLRVDFAIPPELELKLELGIVAPRREVFRALIDPALLARWIGEAGKLVIEPQVGGRLDFGWGGDGGPVQIQSIEPDREISYSWRYPGEPETVVTWSLTDTPAGTRLVLVHAGFDDHRLDHPYRTGWTKFLNRVKHLVESGPSWEAARTIAHDYEAAR